MSNLSHDSAHTHVQGKSEYIDDRPFTTNELHVGVVFSPHARAKIIGIDSKEALAFPNVVGVFTAKDFHHNLWGTIFQDQPLIAENEVRFVGEPVAVVAAETAAALLEAKRQIKVEYAPLDPILSIDHAKKEESFIGSRRKIERGDITKAFSKCDHVIEGKITIKGADHFYLESQAALAYPKEDGQIEVHSSSQHPTEVQHVVAHALGLDSKDVVCIVKRMGGAFGGKESQGAPFAAFAALVAQKLKRPARIILNKDDDMIMTGKRNPFENIYKVGFNKDGSLQALDVELYSDGGAYADLSTAIMERAMLHSDNAYFIPNVRIQGQVCRTNFHPHTAFRGFGGPKGVATIEKIIEEIAHHLKIDPLNVRMKNVYRPGFDLTPYGQKVDKNYLPELFEELEKDCDYRKRRTEIEKFNKNNPNFLRGLSLTAVKFGISFTTRYLNQGNALVIVHRDGSVQVSTGATEMGQGVNARIAEIVCTELGIPRHHVRVMPTSTDKNANTSPTAASSGTDLNGSAALLATRKIKHRLSEVASKLFEIPKQSWAKETAALGTQKEIEVKNDFNSKHPSDDGDWLNGTSDFFGVKFENGKIFRKGASASIGFTELVNETYLNRVSLSDYAHYRVPDLSFNKLTGVGDAFLYYTSGVAATEVQLDLMTGEVKTLRTDILMDLGRPVNEALDLGQVYGGFVQGLGWVTTEHLFYSEKGALLSHSPSTYKIPNVQDTPRVFNAHLIHNDENKRNIRGSKASGEPPLLLAISAWTAISNALSYLPNYRGVYPHIPIPATQEVVLRASYPDRFKVWD